MESENSELASDRRGRRRCENKAVVAASRSKDDEEMERCSMTSDIVRFLRIGFLLTMNELLLDIRDGGSDGFCETGYEDASLSGP